MADQSNKIQKFNARNIEHGHYDKIPREGYIHPVDIPEFSNPEFLGDKAWDWAIYISQPRFNEKFKKWETGNNLSTHQVRRYYGEFKALERNITSGANEQLWAETFARLKLIIAKATYDANRPTSNLPPQFKVFIEKSVRVIPHDFKEGFIAFKNICLFFEAVVGYSSEYTRT